MIKNIVEVDYDSSRKENPISIGKPLGFDLSGMTKEQWSESVVLDMATLCEGICTLIHLAEQNGLKNSADSVRDCIKHIQDGFSDCNYETGVTINKSIFELEEERFKWSLETFPEASALGSLKKLKEEVAEIEVNITNGERDIMEYADCLMCLFDSARRQEEPILIQEIFDAFEKKLEINKKRTWIKNDKGSYSHVK